VSAVHSGPVTGLLALVLLLAALAGTVGLGGAGWVVGIACGATTSALLSRGLAFYRADRLGPADWVTLARATLAGGVAALTADAYGRPTPVTTLVTLVTLTVVALVLDAVDGWVARRTETESALGGRFDGEVDAFLILVLSVYVARSAGAWVLAIGAARYAFLAAGWLLPWMRRTLPPRYWRKVVAAAQGIALTVAVAGALPGFLTNAVLVVALALLAESFGRDVGWLWRRRSASGPAVSWSRPGARNAAAGVEAPLSRVRTSAVPPPRHPTGERPRVRSAAAGVVTLLACLLVWFALVAPNELGRLTPGAFVRLPLEALLFVGVVLVLPPRAGRVAAVAVGVVLGLLAIVNVLDMGFSEALGRPFDLGTDGGYLGSAVGVLGDSIGRTEATVATAAAGLAAVAVLVLAPLSVLRLTRIVGRHRPRSLRAVTALGVVWALCAVAGVGLVPGAPLASTSAAGLAFDEVGQVYAGVKDQQRFRKAAAVDAFRDAPGADLLTGLRGKDVIVAFVESYGRVAVQDSAVSPQVGSVLDAGTRRLRAAGFSAESAFLTSPTFGGISWLAHATLHSGLWVDNQRRYDELVVSDRLTLSGAFRRAGWRTVGDVPSNNRDWPEGRSFYRYDQLYDKLNVGYAGPRFGYANMPDQYTLSAFQRLELARPDRAPVMAEIDLVSSHTPWAPLPRLVGWNVVGDGSVFDGMPEQGRSPRDVWRHPGQVQAAYGQSIEYSLNALISFVETYADNDLVLVVLGDHQPAAIVSGQGASHDVPITIISHDPAVMDRIAPWGWPDGLRPAPDAPVWPMDAFRDRFLNAFGPPSR